MHISGFAHNNNLSGTAMATTPLKSPSNTSTHCTAEAATHERECLNAFRRLLSLCVTLLGVNPSKHETLQNGLLRKSQNKALNSDFTPMGNVILLCASVGVFAIHHSLTDIKNLHLQNSSIHYSKADFTLNLNKSPLYTEGITMEEAEQHLSDSLLICSAADDRIEIIWENNNLRPKVRITSNEILNAVSMPGRHTHTLNQYQPSGAIYHDLLNASISHNQPLTAAIQRIQETLDQELNMMKAKGDKGKHY
ncbi:hypothetical protein GX50_03880 [[Emmonsia] crescens]|uniref:Uncharacterized protein n=1 Tax=[Emmonsia] crescens TaxID=73230 RepID=A0A2B7ZKI2_9EURO|nr:hypothetical protein GX50_03880 [Emmonsia crescens]